MVEAAVISGYDLIGGLEQLGVDKTLDRDFEEVGYVNGLHR